MTTRSSPADWRMVPYRLRQFWRGLHAAVTPAELAAVAVLLPPPAFALFQRMSIDAQRHGLNVWQTVQRAGNGAEDLPLDLAAAALLHDVGKAAAEVTGWRINVWWRSLLVLLELVTPQSLNKLALADPQAGWRYLLYVHLAHPAIGAQWAAENGCSALTCWLIAQHQTKAAATGETEQAKLLARLQWADVQN